jgi:hypothetical protein
MGAGARGSGGVVRGTAWSWQAAEHSRHYFHVAVLLSKKTWELSASPRTCIAARRPSHCVYANIRDEP